MRGGKRQGAGRPRGSKSTPKLCLVGEPHSPARSAPTSARERTEALKWNVALQIAAGLDEIAIANVMRLKPVRLRALFAHELDHGRDIVRAKALQHIGEAMAAGSLAGAKKLEQLTSIPTDASGPSKALGKKEIAAIASRNAEVATAWEEIVAPRPAISKSEEGDDGPRDLLGNAGSGRLN